MIKLYTDGGASPNPGPAGWGAVLIKEDGSALTANGFIGVSTNQVAELMGATEGLKLTPEGASVELICDSQYVLKGLGEWRKGWEAKGMRNSKGVPVANGEFWKALYAVADKRKLKLTWVKGHSGNKFNEMADEQVALARASARK